MLPYTEGVYSTTYDERGGYRLLLLFITARNQQYCRQTRSTRRANTADLGPPLLLISPRAAIGRIGNLIRALSFI